MRLLALGLVLTAGPALAHHEVVMVSSLLPLFGGLMSIAVAGSVAWSRKLRQRRTKLRDLNRKTV